MSAMRCSCIPTLFNSMHDNFMYLKVNLPILHPANYNIRAFHFALTAGDAKSDPSCCLRLHSEIYLLVCSAHIPVQLNIIALVQGSKERMLCNKIGWGKLQCDWIKEENADGGWKQSAPLIGNQNEKSWIMIKSGFCFFWPAYAFNAMLIGYIG